MALKDSIVPPVDDFEEMLDAEGAKMAKPTVAARKVEGQRMA